MNAQDVESLLRSIVEEAERASRERARLASRVARTRCGYCREFRMDCDCLQGR